ncbi:MAG TPA: hypothetical protein VH538_09480, partial [Gaiellaceae bacterium]
NSGKRMLGGGPHEAQIGQVAVSFVEVEAVADEELVGDREADVADGQVVDEASVRAVEEGGDVQGGGIAERQRPDEVVHRQPGVDHLVDEDDVAAVDLVVEVLEEPDAVVTAVALPVTRQLDEVERVQDRERARQVADEGDRRLQRADEQRLEPVVVACDLRPDLADPRGELTGAEEDVADARVVDAGLAQDAFWSPKRAASRSKSRS